MKYRVELVSSKGPDLRRVFRLVVGAALVAFAPAISGWDRGVLRPRHGAVRPRRRVARVVPRVEGDAGGGGVAKTGGAVVAALAAVIVPAEDLSRVVEGYVALMLKPAQLVFRAVVEQNPDEAGLPVALFATTLALVGAGVGFWVVRRWLVDPFSGGVEPTVAGFSCAAMRAIGIVLSAVQHVGHPVRRRARGGRRRRRRRVAGDVQDDAARSRARERRQRATVLGEGQQARRVFFGALRVRARGTTSTSTTTRRRGRTAGAAPAAARDDESGAFDKSFSPISRFQHLIEFPFN